jgi:glycosyltransferase involved in cell wall biosynthesis
MSDRPLVSVVIPTCNRRAILGRCLEALADQTYRPFEVIVTDDGSNDDTPLHLARFAAEHPGLSFRWFRNEPQIGANPSRNRGIRESRGVYVAFADDDSIAAADWLEKLIAGFVSDRVAAVTGRVNDPAPRNIYELTHKGTHRVHGRIHATRLVAGNMCVRRDLLTRYMLDEDRAAVCRDRAVSGRGDEEGLFLSLRAAGYEQRVAHDAIVVHEHGYTARSFLRQAYRGGRSAARLGYKYYLPPRIELVPLACAYLTVPLAACGVLRWALPGILAGAFLAAILYNDLFRKRKTPIETLITLPWLLVYYHLRLFGYVWEYLRLWFGRPEVQRVRLSRLHWR